MLSKKEIELCNVWQFFDRYGYLPFERKRVDLTISWEAYIKLHNNTNFSRIVDGLILGERIK